MNEPTRQAGYRYEIRPTAEQVDALWRTFSHCRVAYNFAVGRRKDLWKYERCKITATELDAEWTDVKARNAWLFDSSAAAQQQALADASKAFVNWWAGRAKAPRFKGKKRRERWASARWVRTGFRLRGTGRDQVLYLAGVGELKVLWSRDLPSDPSSVTVRCTPTGRWFVSFRVEVRPAELPITTTTVGIDLGVGDRLWTTSDGEIVENPRHLRRSEKRLARTQRHVSRKQVGSRRWKRTQRRVAKLHERTTNRRKDYQHKQTTALVRRANVATQADRPKAWMRSKNLGKSTADAAPGRTFSLIDYKADWYGRDRGRVGQFIRTTGVCPDDGAKTKLSLSERVFTCPSCGVVHDRDYASARVILVLAQWDAGRDTKDAASVSGQEDRPPAQPGPSQGMAA